MKNLRGFFRYALIFLNVLNFNEEEEEEGMGFFFQREKERVAFIR